MARRPSPAKQSSTRREAPSRRQGRGRLSSIDLLPEDAEPDVVWAIDALRERNMHGNAILAEFNARLADRGIKKISKSAWSRYAVRKALSFRRLDEVRRISNELVSVLDPDSLDDVTVATAEMVKFAAFQMLEKPDELSSKSIMELSRALATAVSAQKGSAEHRKRLEADARAKIETALDRAEAMAIDAGLDGDRIAQLRREFLGIKS